MCALYNMNLPAKESSSSELQVAQTMKPNSYSYRPNSTLLSHLYSKSRS